VGENGRAVIASLEEAPHGGGERPRRVGGDQGDPLCKISRNKQKLGSITSRRRQVSKTEKKRVKEDLGLIK